MKNTQNQKEAEKKLKIKKLTFDELWKASIEVSFEDFMKFFFPQIAKHIDFKEKIIFRDKELIKIFKDVLKERTIREKRFVDLLVEVSLKDKQRKTLFIHIEIQGYEQESFEKRMFLYYALLYIKLQRDLISLCLFIVKNLNYRPNKFIYKFEDFKLEFIYPAVNIYELKTRALKYIEKGIKNIYADITLLFFEEMEIDKRLEKKEDIKSIVKDFIKNYFEIFKKRLIEKGYLEKQIEIAFLFLEMVIFKKKRIGKYVEKEVLRAIQEEEKMPTLSRILRRFEERGLRKGLEEGLRKGLEEGLRKGLEEGFQKGLKQAAINMYREGLSLDLIAKVTNVDVETIKSWLKEEDLF